jgi:hypothetical protein
MEQGKTNHRKSNFSNFDQIYTKKWSKERQIIVTNAILSK